MTRTRTYATEQAYQDIATGIGETLLDMTTNNVRDTNAYAAERAGAHITHILKALLKRQITEADAEDLLEIVDRDIWSF